MGALECEVDVEHQSVRGEFNRGQTHGIGEYRMDRGAMTGQFVILPDRSVGREVKAHRVAEKEVPPAPPASEYAE